MKQQHSQINPPVKKKKNRFPAPPAQSSDNLEKLPSSDTGLLQFHVPIEIKREFKVLAAEQDISQLQLFLKIFNRYKK